MKNFSLYSKQFVLKGLRRWRGQPGYVSLISVIVLGSFAGAMTFAMLYLGSLNTSTSLAKQRQAEAIGLADACAEEALQVIRENTSFSGTGSLSLGNGSCDYSVSSLGGENREIESEATVSQYTKRVRVEIDSINPQINITDWNHLADF